mgnify:CR=1 FL=1
MTRLAGFSSPFLLGFDEIELVKTVEESLIFALPPELRRDIKAASAR